LWKLVHDAIQAFGKRSDNNNASVDTHILVLQVRTRSKKTRVPKRFAAMCARVLGETITRLGLKIDIAEFQDAVIELVDSFTTSSLQVMDSSELCLC
jgi:hypothetical protein